MKNKFKIGQLVKLTNSYNKWCNDHAFENYSRSGILHLLSLEEILDHGINQFSYINGMDIYALIEGDNGYKKDAFAYRVYYFNELGFGWGYIGPKDLEKL